MHIWQIEVDNFKSFSDKTTIPLRAGFTTISGPNGSGKSNIIDSILFCLGLSSSRTMRAEKLTDLINNLSKRKEAQVTITFVKDPSLLQAETLKEATQAKKESQQAEEAQKEIDHTQADNLIRVSRRVKVGGSGYTSTYYLNDQTSTLTEIHEHLGQFNISPGCFNVMMQGDVAGFVNMSPMERRKIIDEIAGVAEFDRKIEQADAELTAAGLNIERNEILLGEINLRLEQLTQERTHALKYQALRDERQKQESQLVYAHYRDLLQALDGTKSNLAKARNDKQQTEADLKKQLAELEQVKATLLKMNEAVKQKGEDQQIAIKKQIEGLKGHIARKEDASRFLDQQATEGQQAITRMEAEILRQQEKIDTLQSEAQGFTHQLKELQALFATEEKAYQQVNKKFDALAGSGDETSQKRQVLRQQLDAATDTFSQLNRELLDKQAEVGRLAQDSQKSQELQARQQQAQTELKQLEAEKQAFEAQLNQAQVAYSQSRVAVNQAAAKVQEQAREVARLEAQKKAYDEVSFARSVELVLNSGIQGVHGTLAQLADVDEDYALALEIAMGGRLQNIVVDDDQVAEACIRYLQAQKGGRATFLPLNKIQPRRSLPALPRGSGGSTGIVGFAYNLMAFEAGYEDVFAYALGDTLIVEDMSAARPLLRQFRMVTRDGSLMEKSGAMTGGSTPNAGKAGGSKFLGSQKLDQQVLEAHKKFEKTEATLAQQQKLLNQQEQKLEGLKAQYANHMPLHARALALTETLAEQLQGLSATAKGPEATQLQQAEAELKKAIIQQQASVEALQAELNLIEGQLPTEQLNTLRQEMSEVKFQMDYYDSQIRNVQADIKSKQMEQQFQQAGIDDHRQRITQIQEQFKTHDSQKAELAEEIMLTQRQIDDLEAQMQTLDEELKQLQAERDTVQLQLLELEKQKSLLERQKSQLDEQILAFQGRQRELEAERQTLEAEMIEAGLPLENIDLSILAQEDEIQKVIQKLTRQMEALEPVNMLAIQEYDEVLARQQELSDKIETLNRERETLTVKIGSYQELKLLSFRKAFDSVDSHFKAIFAELADGEARLVLTNPESPFEGGMTIEAQPRGKKMQRIEAMSGGEKSLTSLAFVFSLQRFMPAPFYALDEVDMNLDGINVEKLANMVKRESKAAQFIVVSLRKPMIERSDQTVGVTQRRNGATLVTGVKWRDEFLPEHLTDEALASSPAEQEAVKSIKKPKKKERSALAS